MGLRAFYFMAVGVGVAGMGALCPQAQAQILPQEEITYEKIYKIKARGGWDFIAPNEKNPQQAIPALKKTPGGVYLSVGTERAFIGAALSNADHLMILDYDRLTLLFNRINIALLKAAPDRESYLKLRLEASAAKWLSAAETLPSGSPERVVLSDLNSFKWWEIKVRKGAQFERPQSFFELHQEKPANGAFVGANYLWDDELFSKLHQMALDNKIEAHLVDLRDAEATSRVARAIYRAKGAGSLAALDVSNAWDGAYVGKEPLDRLFETLDLVARPDSLVMITHNKNGGWKYFTRSFGAVRNKDVPYVKWPPAAEYVVEPLALPCKQGLLRRMLTQALALTIE